MFFGYFDDKSRILDDRTFKYHNGTSKVIHLLLLNSYEHLLNNNIIITIF